jgi:hypothetical protein
MYGCANHGADGDRFQWVAKRAHHLMYNDSATDLADAVVADAGYLVANDCPGGKWCLGTQGGLVAGTSQIAPCGSHGTEFMRRVVA